MSEVIIVFTFCCKQRGTGPFERRTAVDYFSLMMPPFSKRTPRRMNLPPTVII